METATSAIPFPMSKEKNTRGIITWILGRYKDMASRMRQGDWGRGTEDENTRPLVADSSWTLPVCRLQDVLLLLLGNYVSII